MTAIAYTTSWPQEGKKHRYTWASVTESDTCLALDIQELPQDISVEFDGTWGGASGTIVGTNNTATIPMTAMDGSTAAWTADALFSMLQRPGSITPTFAGGSSQSMTVTIILWY